MLIQKSMGMVWRILSLSFFSLFLRASDNTEVVMKKQIRNIHSVFSHVGSRPFSFFATLVNFEAFCWTTLTALIEVAIF